MKKILFALCCSTLLSACSGRDLYDNAFVSEAQVTDTTRAGQLLAELPPPKRQLPVVVYDFQDQTGQFRNNGLYTDYSSAVTKGGLSILVKSLLDTSNGKWFTVAERNGLNDLIKERQIIRTERSSYTRPDGTHLPDLPALLYGGMLLEGGIIFYDSNVLSGGAAAGYFGITGSTEYHRDIVTVYLSAIDINTGKVILAVNSSKTVFSYALNAGVTHYLTFDRLFEAETGYTVNEPGQIAVRQAIETSLYSLIMEGAQQNLWSFADEAAGKQAIADYLGRKNASSHQTQLFDKPGSIVAAKALPVADSVRPVTQPMPSAPVSQAAPAVVPAPAPVAAATLPEPKKIVIVPASGVTPQTVVEQEVRKRMPQDPTPQSSQ
jgi:curli production assembly/transport component CsgG